MTIDDYSLPLWNLENDAIDSPGLFDSFGSLFAEKEVSADAPVTQTPNQGLDNVDPTVPHSMTEPVDTGYDVSDSDVTSDLSVDAVSTNCESVGTPDQISEHDVARLVSTSSIPAASWPQSVCGAMGETLGHTVNGVPLTVCVSWQHESAFDLSAGYLPVLGSKREVLEGRDGRVSVFIASPWFSSPVTAFLTLEDVKSGSLVDFETGEFCSNLSAMPLSTGYNPWTRLIELYGSHHFCFKHATVREKRDLRLVVSIFAEGTFFSVKSQPFRVLSRKHRCVESEQADLICHKVFFCIIDALCSLLFIILILHVIFAWRIVEAGYAQLSNLLWTASHLEFNM
eukprot:ANDGO_07243.mRNA.1 hypothetical protein